MTPQTLEIEDQARNLKTGASYRLVFQRRLHSIELPVRAEGPLTEADAVSLVCGRTGWRQTRSVAEHGQPLSGRWVRLVFRGIPRTAALRSLIHPASQA